MLQAKMENGKLLLAAELPAGEISKLKEKKHPFYCPVCKEPVILKAGTKVIPHFAHRSVNHCPATEGGEGLYHYRGKLLLYRWLKRQHLDVALEQYVPEINQRPDLLLHIRGKIIAIEYQCAQIPQEEVYLRIDGYTKAGIIPIWILGANRLKRRTSIHYRVDQMTIMCTYQFLPENPKVIYYFCPNTLQFILLSDLYLTQGNQAIAKLKTDRINKLTFKDLFHFDAFSNPELFRLWKKEKKHFRLKQRKRAYGTELAWQQWLYAKGTSIDFLPSVIHLPISSQYRMRTPLWNWQSRLCLELIDPLPIGGELPLKACERLLRNHISGSTAFPLIQSQMNPIEEYVSLLVQLQILRQDTPTVYVKTKPLEFHQNVEVAVTKDMEVMDQLLEPCKKE